VCSSASGASPSFKITSTLDGKTLLPDRIHWLAFPRVPASTKVEFLIDGKVLWAERDAPYTFSDDGGYLVTSWPAPGKHRFTVRATVVRVGDKVIKEGEGQVAESTVVASVPRAPEPPAELAGMWQRTPDVTDHPTFPAGTYKLVFDRRWIPRAVPGNVRPGEDARERAGDRPGVDRGQRLGPRPDHVPRSRRGRGQAVRRPGGRVVVRLRRTGD
jgi:hypothetical protein